MYYPGYYDNMYNGPMPFVNGTYIPPPLPQNNNNNNNNGGQQRGRSRSRGPQNNDMYDNRSVRGRSASARRPSNTRSEPILRDPTPPPSEREGNNDHCNCNDCKRKNGVVDYDMIDRTMNDTVRREITEYDNEIGRRLSNYRDEMFREMREKLYDEFRERMYQEVFSEVKESMESYVDESFQYHTTEANEQMRDKILQCMANDPYRKNVLPEAPPGQQYYFIQTPEQWMQMSDGTVLYLPAQSVPMLGSPYIAPSGTPLQGSNVSLVEPGKSAL
jgi:hypothetical protein